MIRSGFLTLLLAVISMVLTVMGAFVGSNGWGSVSSLFSDPVAMQIVLDIRLPRTAGAWLTGALLGLGGALAQGLFRNPLADPYLLGSSSGASLGVVLLLAALGSSSASLEWSIILGSTGAAFLGAVAAVFLTLLLATGVAHTLRLLLAGVVVGVVLGACSALVMMLVPSVMQTMQAFMLGSTAFLGWQSITLMLLVLLIGLLLSCALASVLDGLSLGESTAVSLGLPVQKARLFLVLVLALLTGTAVAHCGLIAFVGLAAPHLVRSLLTVKHRALMVLSSLMGGILLSSADLLARSFIAPMELPVGVITAILGGSYLLWQMHRQTLVTANT
jgi:iron complex transport system permease protein